MYMEETDITILNFISDTVKTNMDNIKEELQKDNPNFKRVNGLIKLQDLSTDIIKSFTNIIRSNIKVEEGDINEE